MNSNCTPPDETIVHSVPCTERKPLPGKAIAKVLSSLLRMLPRNWQRGLLRSVDNGLPEILADALRQDLVNGKETALAIIRLAEFPTFSEGFGDHLGNQLSHLFQCRLRQGLRDSDLLEPLSEVEFALLLSDVKQPADIGAIVQRQMDRATGLYRLKGQRFHVNADAGVAMFPTDAVNPDDLLRYARVALR